VSIFFLLLSLSETTCVLSDGLRYHPRLAAFIGREGNASYPSVLHFTLRPIPFPDKGDQYQTRHDGYGDEPFPLSGVGHYAAGRYGWG
jgi:hypothetical protein